MEASVEPLTQGSQTGISRAARPYFFKMKTLSLNPTKERKYYVKIIIQKAFALGRF
jgi:hypothetical protein